MFRNPVLVSRESAHEIGRLLDASLGQAGTVILDFEGVEGTTLSFVDEIFGLIDRALRASARRSDSVLIKNLPAPGLSPLPALAHRHGLDVNEIDGEGYAVTARARRAAG